MADVNVVTAVYGKDWTLAGDLAEAIRAVDPRVRLTVPVNKDELAAALPLAEVLFGRWPGTEELRAAKNLRWVQLASAGADSALASGAGGSGIMLTTAAGIHAIQISEHVLAMMLMFARRMLQHIDCQRQSRWDRAASAQIDELYGKTIGIVGLGAIGAEVARKAKAFNMTVLASKRVIDEAAVPDVDELLPPDRLDDLLKRSDYVVLAVPLTPATTRLIGSRELGLMKPSAVLINIARGAVVDEQALIDALKENRIAGAGLDTFVREPLPPESPLWQMPNVLITPHIAGATPVYWQRATAVFCENLRRYLDGKPLRNVVEVARGY